MRVLFIYPDICTFSDSFQEGIGIILSILKDKGHKTFLLHITKKISKKNLIEKIKKIKPDIVAFSSTTNQYNFVKLFSKWIKEEFDLPIICGGVHSTILPEEVINYEYIDILCRGEGEYPMLELIQKMAEGKQYKNIKNLWVKKDGKISKNGLRPLIKDLDTLPFSDRELFNYRDLLKRHSCTAAITVGRGCPFACTYCCNHVLNGIYKDKGPYVRLRSTNHVINEIEFLLENYKINKILFNDDTFTLYHKYVKILCSEYSKKFDVPFVINARVETLNRDIISTLKKAGCEQVQIGIESGNEWFRKNVLKRNMTNERIIKAFRLTKEAGLKTFSFNIIGFPYETPKMIEDTINLNKKISPDSIQISIFYPYPNTELYKICLEKNLLLKKTIGSFFDFATTIRLQNMDEKKLLKYFNIFKNMNFENKVLSKYKTLYPLYKITTRLFNGFECDLNSMLLKGKKFLDKTKISF